MTRPPAQPSTRPAAQGLARAGRWKPWAVVLLLALLGHMLLLARLPSGAGGWWGDAVRPSLQVRRVVSVPVASVPPAAALARSEAPAEPAVTSSGPEPPVTAPLAAVAPTAEPAASAVDGDTASATAAADAPAAEPGGWQLPTFATRVPPSALLSYEIVRGGLRGQAELSWRVRPEGYSASLQGSAVGLPILSWASQGTLDANGVAPLRFVDRRRSRDVRAANFQREAGRITFSGPSIEYPLLPGSQDRLSWMLQLPAIVDAAPQDFLPGARIAMFVAGARGDADVWTFTVEAIEAVELAGSRVERALRLLREPRRPFDTRVEVWLDPARHHLPVRMRLVLVHTGDSSEFVLQQLSFTPP